MDILTPTDTGRQGIWRQRKVRLINYLATPSLGLDKLSTPVFNKEITKFLPNSMNLDFTLKQTQKRIIISVE